MMKSTCQVRTGVVKGRIASNTIGSRCAVFDNRQLVVYRMEDDTLLECYRLQFEGLAGCAFFGQGKLAVSTESSPPRIIDVESGIVVDQIAEPMKATLRSRYGSIYSRGSGNAYLRTSYPHLLIKIDADTLLPTNAIAAESVSEVVLHRHRDVFACVVDAMSQEIAIGSFEDNSFYEFSLSELPYVYSIGMSLTGNHLCLVGSDGNTTVLQVISMESLEIVGVRPIDLSLEATIGLTGNDRQIFIISKTLPAIGEDSVLLFKSGGEAILTSLAGEVVIDSPHKTAVTSVVQSCDTEVLLSLDWDGLMAMWRTSRSYPVGQPCEWKFLRGGKVNSSYETRSKSIIK